MRAGTVSPKRRILSPGPLPLLKRVNMANKIEPGKLPDWVNERRKEADRSPHSGRIHREIIDKISPVANHGTKFQVQPGQQRLDPLGRLTLKVMQELKQELGREPTAREVFEFLISDYTGIEIGGCKIQDVEREGSPEDDKLCWLSNGRDKDLTFKAFQKRITLLRKKLLHK